MVLAILVTYYHYLTKYVLIQGIYEENYRIMMNRMKSLTSRYFIIIHKKKILSSCQFFPT